MSLAHAIAALLLVRERVVTETLESFFPYTRYFGNLLYIYTRTYIYI
jgi:hypothetical protein